MVSLLFPIGVCLGLLSVSK